MANVDRQLCRLLFLHSLGERSGGMALFTLHFFFKVSNNVYFTSFPGTVYQLWCGQMTKSIYIKEYITML